MATRTANRAAVVATALLCGAAHGQSAEIEITAQPGLGGPGIVPITATVRWSGAVALAELRGSIVVTPASGHGQDFESEFRFAAGTIDLGTFDGPSRVGMSVESFPPGLVGGMVFSPFGNSAGITVARYDVFTHSQGLYAAYWLPEPGFESVKVYPTTSSLDPVAVPTASISDWFIVGICWPPGCVACAGDLTGSAVAGAAGYGVPNAVLNNEDFFYYLARFAVGDRGRCDRTASAVPGTPGYGLPNGVLNNDDFFYYLDLFAQGC